MSLVDPMTVNSTMTSLKQIDDDVTSSVMSSVVGRYRPSGITGVTGSSPWLWAPHVTIGALLLALMAASFVRFHCKYGHKYRTGSQFLSATGLRTAPKNAWMSDKKGSSSTRLPTLSGVNTVTPGTSVSMTASTVGRTGRTGVGRSVAVIVLRPVGETMQTLSGSKNQFPVSRRSADPVLLGGSSIQHNSVIGKFPEVIYTTATTSAGSSNISIDTAHMQQTEVCSNMESEDATTELSLRDAAEQCEMLLTAGSVWNNGGKTSGNNRQLGEITVNWGVNEGAAAGSDTLRRKATNSSCRNNPESVLLSVDSVSLNAAVLPANDLRPNRLTTTSPVATSVRDMSTLSAMTTTPANWSWPSSVAATTSSVRNSLMRRQPTLVSPSSEGQSDTEKLLLLDDCDDRLLVL